MDSTLGRISSSMSTVSQPMSNLRRRSFLGFKGRQQQTINTIHVLSNNGDVSRSLAHAAPCNAVEDAHRQRSSLESLFCYDKAIPEEIIETPVGLSLAEKIIGDNPSCPDCQAKGAVLCRTCSGSGLYVDSILESQGIIVKVRCLGCGGTGNILCLECGGRGHVDLK